MYHKYWLYKPSAIGAAQNSDWDSLQSSFLDGEGATRVTGCKSVAYVKTNENAQLPDVQVHEPKGRIRSPN